MIILVCALKMWTLAGSLRHEKQSAVNVRAPFDHRLIGCLEKDGRNMVVLSASLLSEENRFTLVFYLAGFYPHVPQFGSVAVLGCTVRMPPKKRLKGEDGEAVVPTLVPQFPASF